MLPAPHLNDYLKRLLPLAGLKSAEILKALRVPYLTLAEGQATSLTSDDIKAVALLSLEDGMTRCPFDEFRYCMDFKDGAVFGWARRRLGSMLIVNLYRHKGKLLPHAQVVTVYPKTDAFSGTLECDGRIIRVSDLKDVTAELKEVMADKGPRTSTPPSSMVKDEAARAMIEQLSAGEQARLFDYLAGPNYADPRLGCGKFFDGGDQALRAARLEVVCGKLDVTAVINLLHLFREKTTTIQFDTSKIANPEVRKLIEQMPPTAISRLIEEAIKQEAARSLARTDPASTTQAVDDLRRGMLTSDQVLSRLSVADVNKLSSKLVHDLRGEASTLQREADDIHGKVNLLGDMKVMLDSHAARGDAVSAGSLMLTQDDCNEIFIACYRSMMNLCYEFLTPTNFTAQVTPKGNGKSVEWLQAREHYTIIHRHHEANQKGLADGTVVKSDPNRHLKRTAHSRRAHSRLLKAAKWTYMRGQTVSVRAHWCGPKEWQDTAGQTYKILVPV